jgi:hypothetical protein
MGKKQFDIYLSCSDPHNLCSIKKDGKGVGGYAYQYDGWFGYKVSHPQPIGIMDMH